jgi:uncharacterized membrane protein
MWMNHHRLFTLLLLLGVTWIPFPTALLAEHLTTTNDRVAAVVYAASFFMISIVFQVLWRHAMQTEGILLIEKTEEAHSIHRQYRWGPYFYVAAILIALVNGTACLIWSALLGIYFALPPKLWARR